MTPFKFDDKDINIPAGWHELTVLHLQKVNALDENHKADFCSLLEIFTGIEYKKWFDAQLTELNVEQLALALAWVAEPINFNELPLPETIIIGEKTLVIPKDLAIKTLGQKQRFEQVALPAFEANKNLVSCMAELLAIYFQPIYTDKNFSTDTIDVMIRLCEQCKAVEAFPVVAFFLRMYYGLEKKNRRSNIRETPSTKQQQKVSLTT